MGANVTIATFAPMFFTFAPTNLCFAPMNVRFALAESSVIL